MAETGTRAGDGRLAPTVGTPVEEAGTAGAFPAPALPTGRFGPYRLLREIGRGGMGTVYLAERADDQYHKQVAVKLLQGGVERDEIVRRFRRERQILASLDHPHIARLLDGGTTDDGTPYFVMEHIEGQRIDAYCDARRLSTRQRLALFQSVCAAVQHAHRNLVVHRDLKPGNILVTAEGLPKLLDFGIATLLDPGPSAAAPTATGLAMTPEYASPEQARGEKITTASDVYSLGVILYELLTGQRPYRFRSRNPLEVLRVVIEQEPPRPSTAVERMRARAVAAEEKPVPATAEAVSEAREDTPARLQRRLRGDLDNIVMMALRKEPARRYPSVEAFAEDIRRHLDGLPINARKGTVAYRASKFVRRHRVSVAAAAAVLVLLVGFAATMAVQSTRLARERDRVARERDKAEKVSAFLVDIFKGSDPYEAPAAQSTREFLERGAERVRRELTDQPDVRATLLDAIGAVFVNLGDLDRAEAVLNEALAARRSGSGGDAALARTLSHMGELIFQKGDYRGAEAAWRESLELRRRIGGGAPAEVAAGLTNVARSLDRQGRYAEAEPPLREALTLAGQAGDEALRAQVLNDLAGVLQKRGGLAAAEEAHRDALAIRRRLFGSRHPIVAQSLTMLSVTLSARGTLDAAEAALREALGIRRAAFGDEHPRTVTTIANLGAVLHEKGKLAAAGELTSEALRIRRRILGPDHPDTAGTLVRMATITADKGDLGPAEAMAREGVDLLRRRLGESPRTANAEVALADILGRRGKDAQAEMLLRAAMGVQARALGDDHTEVARTRLALAECLSRQRRPAGAGAGSATEAR